MRTCPKGHVRPDRGKCPECVRASNAAWYARQKAAGFPAPSYQQRMAQHGKKSHPWKKQIGPKTRDEILSSLSVDALALLVEVQKERLMA